MPTITFHLLVSLVSVAPKRRKTEPELQSSAARWRPEKCYDTLPLLFL
jgi:hypothetical protein